MILLVDNYDSFSYNLVQLLGTVLNGKEEIKVIRNDESTVEEILAMKPSHIIISPGPKRPSDAGVCEELIRKAAGMVPILGVCLGHQAICETFGMTVGYAKELMHGKKSVVTVDTSSKIFEGMEERQEVARYHSLVALPDTINENIKVLATSDDGEIMAVKHTNYEIYGLQFHPESVLTKNGEQMMINFLKRRKNYD